MPVPLIFHNLPGLNHKLIHSPPNRDHPVIQRILTLITINNRNNLTNHHRNHPIKIRMLLMLHIIHKDIQRKLKLIRKPINIPLNQHTLIQTLIMIILRVILVIPNTLIILLISSNTFWIFLPILDDLILFT